MECDSCDPESLVEEEYEDSGQAGGDGEGKHGDVHAISEQQPRRDAACSVVRLQLPAAVREALLVAEI